MKILVCGARGFVGRHVCTALERAGHEVLRGSRKAGDVLMDFSRDTSPQIWAPRLAGVDAVVNAVGVLRDSPRAPMQAIHADTPLALFEACAQAGVRHVIHLSALGIEANPTRYAISKRGAETVLLEHNRQGRLQGVVLRPSIVFGQGGDSTRLFLGLSRLPLLVLPTQALKARVQPLRVQELADAIAALTAPRNAVKGLLNCVGPQALTLADFIASLRTQRGLAAARILAMPYGLSRFSARLGDLLPITPWGSETLSLLSQDNIADPSAFQALLGRPATHHSQLLEPAPWTA